MPNCFSFSFKMGITNFVSIQQPPALFLASQFASLITTFTSLNYVFGIFTCRHLLPHHSNISQVLCFRLTHWEQWYYLNDAATSILASASHSVLAALTWRKMAVNVTLPPTPYLTKPHAFFFFNHSIFISCGKMTWLILKYPVESKFTNFKLVLSAFP